MDRDLRPHRCEGTGASLQPPQSCHKSPSLLQTPCRGWGCRCPQRGPSASLPLADFSDCCHRKGHVPSKPSTPGIRGAAFPGQPRLPAQLAGCYRGRAELHARAPGSGEHGARTRPRQSGGARPSPVQPEGPGRVQRDAARLRLQRRQSLAERLASPGGRGSRGQRHVLRQPGRGQADRAPSSLRAPAPPRPAPPRAPPRPASALPQSNKGRACARSRGPEGEGQRNSHPASPAAGAKDRWKVRPMDQYGWSLRVQQCERGRRGGLTYQQSEGWMGRLADGWRRDGGMEGQMEAQLDVTDRWKEDQWPNR